MASKINEVAQCNINQSPAYLIKLTKAFRWNIFDGSREMAFGLKYLLYGGKYIAGVSDADMILLAKWVEINTSSLGDAVMAGRRAWRATGR